MKLKQYLTESEQPSIQELLELIYDNCKPFINDLVKGGFDYYKRGDNNLFYSGRNDSSIIIKKNIRKNRKPKDTEESVHNAFDKAFLKKFGVKVRSSSIFITGDISVAMKYGKIYTIFPVGKYKMIWSASIKDLYGYSRSEFSQPEFDLHKQEVNIFREYHETDPKKENEEYKRIKKEYDDKILNIAKDFVDGYTEGDIVKAMESRNEVSLIGEKYIGISEHFSVLLATYISKYKTKYPTAKRLIEWSERYGSVFGLNYRLLK